GAGSNGQSVTKHPVVKVFHADARYLANEIDRLQNFAQIYRLNVPRATLLLEYRFEPGGRRAMASAGVEENEVNAGARLPQRRKGKKLTHHPTLSGKQCCCAGQRSRFNSPPRSSISAVLLCTQSPSFR